MAGPALHAPRVMHLPCSWLALLAGVTEPLFAKTSAELVRCGLEDRLISVLRGSVEPPHAAAPSGIGAKPGALTGHMAGVLKEFGGQQGNMVGGAEAVLGAAEALAGWRACCRLERAEIGLW